MPATAKKTAAKPAAKKTAAPARKRPTLAPLAANAQKQAAAAKKTTTRAPKEDPDAHASDEKIQAIATQVVGILKSGILDSEWSSILDAVDERESEMAKIVAAQERKTAAKKAAAKGTVAKEEKKVPLPTRSKISLKVGATYALDAKAVPKLAGATVKFLGHPEGDDKKAKCEIVKEISGAPTGKKVMVPTAALTPVPRRRSTRSVKK